MRLYVIGFPTSSHGLGNPNLQKEKSSHVSNIPVNGPDSSLLRRFGVERVARPTYTESRPSLHILQDVFST